jgi:hypothetical protein
LIDVILEEKTFKDMKTSISPDNGIRYELPKQGLERNRFCTGK